MITATTVEPETSSGLCVACGIPVDSQYFDDSSVQAAPAIGEELVLARFDLPSQYCGILQYFSQFTDTFAVDNSKITTPNIEWKLLVNSHALFPYINVRRIINPWGYGSFPVNIKVDENSTVELVARGVIDDGTAPPGAASSICFVGGRIVGRFWYNSSYGDVMPAGRR